MDDSAGGVQQRHVLAARTMQGTGSDSCISARWLEADRTAVRPVVEHNAAFDHIAPLRDVEAEDEIVAWAASDEQTVSAPHSAVDLHLGDLDCLRMAAVLSVVRQGGSRELPAAWVEEVDGNLIAALVDVEIPLEDLDAEGARFGPKHDRLGAADRRGHHCRPGMSRGHENSHCDKQSRLGYRYPHKNRLLRHVD